MQTRRSVLSLVASAGLVSLSGCPLLSDTTEASSSPARVSEQALDGTGYEQQRMEDFSREDTIEVAGESQEVKLTNWVTEYRRAMPEFDGDIDAASWTLVTSPTVSIAGRDVNPFERMDEERLLRRVLDRIDKVGVENIQQVGERTVSVLGEDVEITQFQARTEEEGIDVFIHMGHLTHDGDFVVLHGIHPTLLDESATMDQLAEGTEHPVDP